MIKTFRGILADGGQDQIYLAGGDGSKGYRIVKFQLIANEPGDSNYESIVKIYKTPQSAVDASIDFSDNTLLGAGFLEGEETQHNTDGVIVVFDKEIVNQDIYITHSEIKSNKSVNYYLELEEVTMSDAEAANVNFVAALVHT